MVEVTSCVGSTKVDKKPKHSSQLLERRETVTLKLNTILSVDRIGNKFSVSRKLSEPSSCFSRITFPSFLNRFLSFSLFSRPFFS